MELLGISDAAEQLGCSQRYVNKMIETGRLRASYIGNRWLIAEHDLTKFANAPPLKRGPIPTQPPA